MTREEAIAIFKGFKFLPREMKAVDMAIKALEQEPCEDAVSRKAVEEMLNARGQKAIMTFDHFIELLYKLPSVTPTRKVGKWICVHHIENKITYDSWKCSECQHDFSSEEESMVDFDEYTYCPNCGADMRGGEEW